VVEAVFHFHAVMGFVWVFFHDIKAHVVVFEIIHLVEGRVGEQAQETSQSPTMHTNEDGVFRAVFDFFESLLLAFHHGHRGFAAIDGLVEFAVSPSLQHRIEFLTRVFAGLLSF